MTKLKWTIFGIFAPELVVYIAYVQRADAKWLYREINGIRKRKSGTAAKEWTMSHSFFATMGGFVYRTSSDEATSFIEGNSRQLVLTTYAVQLLESVDILPYLSEKDIEDKSKADALAKTLVCLQATWLLIQILGRLIAHLPVTLLEINTAGHVFCALSIYALWWDKPLDVKVPFTMYDTTPGVTPYVAMLYMYSLISSTRSDVNGEVTEINCLDFYPPDLGGPGRLSTKLGDIAHPMFAPARTPQTEALQHKSDCQNWNGGWIKRWEKGKRSAEVSRQVPAHEMHVDEITRRRWRLATEAMDYIWRNQSLNREVSIQTNTGLDLFDLHLPIVETYLVKHQSDWVGLALPYEQAHIRLFLSLATAAYGGLHAAAWNAHFPSVVERWFWVASCLFIAASGIMVFLFFGLKDLLEVLRWYGFRNRFIHFFDNYEWPYIVLLVFYAIARGFLVVEAFISLRNVSVRVYDTPVWTQLIPHL